MRRSLVSAVISVLVLSGLAVGCGITPDEPGAALSDTDLQSSAPEAPTTDGSLTDDPASGELAPEEPAPDESLPGESDPGGSDPGESDPDGSTGGSDELCDKLQIISDADLEMTPDMSVDQLLDRWAEMWPEVAEAYDDAIALAPSDLAEDLRLIKRVSEIMKEALAGAETEADVTEAILGLSEDHSEEVMAAAGASIRAEEFTQEECGFSLNNE